MSQRFIRCVHCGLPHDMMQSVCPATGKSIERRRFNTSSIPAQRDPSEAKPRPNPGSNPPVPPPPPPPAPGYSSAPPRNAHRDLIGRTIGGKYLVRSVLGEGGMGAVYEAENMALGRSVAVKVLHPAQARKKIAVKRFHQEARSAGRIGHPNICEVYDLGTLDDGSPYLVMERLIGETLAERIQSEGGLPFDDVIEIVTQVLSGLVAAHEKGIVHRDIKPENIFLTKRVGCPPLVKLLDFGVSKMISPVQSEKEEDLDLTRTGMVMGTPFYMSSEQARGERNLDARVDLYACGVILYEALTGRRPFTAANYNALLLQILTTNPRPARELRPALPLGFDEVLDKSLARSRDDRFQTAAEFQRELQSLRDRHPKAIAGIGVSGMARQTLLRRPTPISAIIPGGARPRAEVPPPPPPPPLEDGIPESEPPPSSDASGSVEIPIMFSDTPLSGEHLPDLEEGSTAIDDQPTEMRERFATSSDADTTERLSHLSLGKPRGPNTARIPRASTTERGAIPVFDLKPSDTESDDNNATLIQSSSPIVRRRVPRGTSPDDTVRMESDATTDVRDARDRLSSPPSAEPSPPARKPKPRS
jgi:eukaryotic-like serine/threonine-protein kinase